MLKLLPDWLHPRFPLVAYELRHYNQLDYQIQIISENLRKSFSVAYFILLFLVAVALLGGGEIFGFLLFPPIIFITPVVVIWTVFLFYRVILTTPVKTSQMIASEIERNSWEILLSIPMARYQIILSKFAGLVWNAEPALTSIMISRIILLMLLVIERFVFTDSSSLGLLILMGLLMAHAPLMEFFALAGIGTLISSLTSTWTANILTRVAWVVLRFIPVVVFIPYYVDQDNSLECLLILILMVPHWTHVLFWLLKPDTVETTGFLAIMTSIHFILPAALGTIGLALTIHLVHRRWR